MKLFFLLVLTGVVFGRVAVAEEATWAFEPERDVYDKGALLDLRSLNEGEAGEHGFIKRSGDGNHFVRGDGRGIRFWAAHSSLYERHDDELKDHARFLAKRGVNMVRWHGHVVDMKGDDLKEVDEVLIDRLWKYVAAMKGEGIYMTLSPYYPHSTPMNAKWGFDSKQKNMTCLLFWVPEVQAAYKEWLRRIFIPKNPYTGVALKDEAAVAIIQVQNEDSMLFWSVGEVEGRERVLLNRRFGAWAKKRYGSVEKAMKAWSGKAVKGDDVANGQLALRGLWEFTSDGIRQNGPVDRRGADEMAFVVRLMRDWNGEVRRFLREEIGSRQLLNAGNWTTADNQRLLDLERYSYSSTEVMGSNHYVNSLHKGKHRGWAIVNGDTFDKVSKLKDPYRMPFMKKQPEGYPMIIPETGWVPPMLYQAEGPMLSCAYMSLAGVDALYWFDMSEAQWRHPGSANGYLPSIKKWVANSPEILGNFPAAALIFRKGLVRAGETVVHEHRSLDDMWHVRLPIISEHNTYDPNRQKGDRAMDSTTVQEVNPLAFLTGPVKVTFDSDSSKTRVSPRLDELIDVEGQVVRSFTDELMLDYGRGLFTINARRAQSATGFFKALGEPVKLGNVVIKCENEYASVALVAMDDRSLGLSKKILVQVGTTCRPTGWKEREVGRENGRRVFKIVDYGRAPWQVVENEVVLVVKNKLVTKAVALDMNGMSTSDVVKLERRGAAVRFRVPKNRKYVVLM